MEDKRAKVAVTVKTTRTLLLPTMKTPNTSAMMASMQVLALDGGKRAEKFLTPNASMSGPERPAQEQR